MLRRGCKQTFHPEASARHANCRSTSRRSDWQKHQHATWLSVLEENQNTDSSTTQYCSTPHSTTLCTAVLTEVTGLTHCICKMTTRTLQDRYSKAFSVAAASQTTPPNRYGGGASTSTCSVWSKLQLCCCKKKHWDFRSTFVFTWWQYWHHPCVSGITCFKVLALSHDHSTQCMLKC